MLDEIPISLFYLYSESLITLSFCGFCEVRIHFIFYIKLWLLHIQVDNMRQSMLRLLAIWISEVRAFYTAKVLNVMSKMINCRVFHVPIWKLFWGQYFWITRPFLSVNGVWKKIKIWTSLRVYIKCRDLHSNYPFRMHFFFSPRRRILMCYFTTWLTSLAMRVLTTLVSRIFCTD